MIRSIALALLVVSSAAHADNALRCAAEYGGRFYSIKDARNSNPTQLERDVVELCKRENLAADPRTNQYVAAVCAMHSECAYDSYARDAIMCSAHNSTRPNVMDTEWTTTDRNQVETVISIITSKCIARSVQGNIRDQKLCEHSARSSCAAATRESVDSYPVASAPVPRPNPGPFPPNPAPPAPAPITNWTCTTYTFQDLPVKSDPFYNDGQVTESSYQEQAIQRCVAPYLRGPREQFADRQCRRNVSCGSLLR